MSAAKSSAAAAGATSTVPAEPDAQGQERSGLAWVDRALLLGVVLLTCVVSLPRFHGLMLAENERDARQAVDLLASASPLPEHGDPSLLEAHLDLREGLAHRLPDLRLAPGGRTARNHGYHLAVVPQADGLAFVAWPEQVGRTGRRAFLRYEDGPLLVSADWARVGLPPVVPQRPAAGQLPTGWQRP